MCLAKVAVQAGLRPIRTLIGPAACGRELRVLDQYIFIYSLVLCFILFVGPLSRPVLIYISLLIISCIIEDVTNKRTLNVEP